MKEIMWPNPLIGMNDVSGSTFLSSDNFNEYNLPFIRKQQTEKWGAAGIAKKSKLIFNETELLYKLLY